MSAWGLDVTGRLGRRRSWIALRLSIALAGAVIVVCVTASGARASAAAEAGTLKASRATVTEAPAMALRSDATEHA